MGFNLQLLFTGIGVGSIYALVALGFALIYRATNVVNFAQGDFAMLGAFAMVVLAIYLELPYGPRPQRLDSVFAVPGFSIGEVFFDSQYILILVVTIVMVALQYVFFERT